jgi:hypothetical protein
MEGGKEVKGKLNLASTMSASSDRCLSTGSGLAADQNAFWLGADSWTPRNRIG